MDLGIAIVAATAIYCGTSVCMQWAAGRNWDKMKGAADLESRVAELERIINE